MISKKNRPRVMNVNPTLQVVEEKEEEHELTTMKDLEDDEDEVENENYIMQS